MSQIIFTKTGSVVTVHEAIGQGSFATVYRAKEQDGKEYALKKIQGNGRQSLDQSRSEINILLALRKHNVSTPVIYDYEVCSLEGDQYTCYILTSMEKGIPLGAFLDQHVLSYTQRLEICAVMLEQLVPTMKVIDSICCHRDLTPSNILFDYHNMKFTIIDFGLAVDKNSWWLYRWRDVSIGGDCRFWPVSGWRMLLDGWTGLSGVCIDHYRERLDMHSLGLSAVTILCTGLDDGITNGLVYEWREYMKKANQAWQVFYSCFRTQGNWVQCKMILDKQLNVISETRSSLRRIRRKLCQLKATHPVFGICEHMLCVDETGTGPNWKYIRSKVLMMAGRDSTYSVNSVAQIRSHY